MVDEVRNKRGGDGMEIAEPDDLRYGGLHFGNGADPFLHILQGFFRIAEFLRGKKQRLHVDSSAMSGAEEPFILLCNHQSFYDFYYVKKLFNGKSPSYVVNRHYISAPIAKTLARKSGFIPKKLFNADAVTARGIMRTIKNGYPVVIFPEGRLCLDGRTNPVVEPGGALYKKLGVDIVIAGIRGAYFANPKWRKRFYKSDVYVEAKRLIKKEEAAEMTADELDAIIEEELFRDESVNPVNVYDRKDLAEGLENLLYRCADCGALYTTETRGAELYCTHCGASHLLDGNCRFDRGVLSISRYYDRIKELERPELASIDLKAEVRTTIFSQNGRYRRREKGECELTASGFSYRSASTSFEIPIGVLPALPFSCGEEFEAYHNDELYYFYPVENRRQVVRWALAVDMLWEENNGKADKP